MDPLEADVFLEGALPFLDLDAAFLLTAALTSDAPAPFLRADGGPDLPAPGLEPISQRKFL